jgi:large subunit ribosomal protein L22
MPEFGYSFTSYDPLVNVRASGRELDVSPKAAREVLTAIKGMRLNNAKRYLEEVLIMKRAVPFRRYNKKVGHKSSLSKFHAGRYPQKATKMILRVIGNLEGNAEFKGMDIDRLVIIHAAASKGRRIRGYVPRAFGRSSPCFNTLTHIELAAKEE